MVRLIFNLTQQVFNRMYLRLESWVVCFSELSKKLMYLPNTLIWEEISERLWLVSLI